MRQPGPEERNAPGLFSRYYYGPRRGLIPAQELPGKSHCNREGKQEDASRPGHLAWEFVGTEQESLRHVRADHQHHGGRAEVMETAQEAAKGRVVCDELQRFVGLRRGRNERKGQSDAGGHLHNETNQRGSSKNVPPLRVVRRDVLHRLEQHADPDAIIEPAPDAGEEAPHKVVEIGTMTELIFTSPFSTRTA